MPSNSTSKSASDETATPHLPTSPSLSGESASRPIKAGRSYATDRPGLPLRHQILEPLVGFFRRRKSGELPHRPQLAAIAGRMNAAFIREFTRETRPRCRRCRPRCKADRPARGETPSNDFFRSAVFSKTFASVSASQRCFSASAVGNASLVSGVIISRCYPDINSNFNISANIPFRCSRCLSVVSSP